LWSCFPGGFDSLLEFTEFEATRHKSVSSLAVQ
jgi:hypothetical protein